LKMKRTPIVLISVVILLCVLLTQKAGAEELFIVATESTRQGSHNWFGFLESEEVPFNLLLPEEFGDYKEEKFIVIMGSINESKDIREILNQILTEGEVKWLSRKGNGNLYLKSDIWTQGQKIAVVAGSDQSALEKVRKVNKEGWYEIIIEWFDLEGNPGGLLPY